jgi:outer membrane protein assembly factor BamB
MNPHRKTSFLFLLGTLCIAVAGAFAGCPKPKPKKTKPKPRTRPVMKFPWRLWSRRVDGQLRVVLATKRRLIAVEYTSAEANKPPRPIALVGLETETGQVRWRREMTPKLLHPLQPWSIELARKKRVLAVWLKDNRILGIDIYTGRNFWKEPRPKSMGVAAVGFGFITGWKDKIYFLKPATGETQKTFDLPAEITGPLRISTEGEAIALCGKKLIAVNLNNGETSWQHTVELKNGMLPAVPELLEERVILGHDTVEQIINTYVMRLNGKSLKPRWQKILKGRIRTHDALRILKDEIQMRFMMRNGKQLWKRVGTKAGALKKPFAARSIKNCVKGDTLIYCPYSRKSSHGIEARNPKTLEVQWSWETITDRSKNEHYYHAPTKTFYVADGKKIVGLNVAGKTVFKARVLQPGLNLQVNRILGIHKGVLVLTAVDWGQMSAPKGGGQIWGITLKTSRRRWKKALPKPLYSSDSVVKLRGRVFYCDHQRVHMIRAGSGWELDNWMHRLPGKVVSPPKLHLTGTTLFITRGAWLSVLNTKNARPSWKKKIPVGSRIVGVATGVLVVRTPNRTLHAFGLKTGKLLWKKQWSEPADPTLVDLTDSAKAGLLLAGRLKSQIVDPKNGKKKGDWSGVVHIAKMAGGDLVAIQVHKRMPKYANVLKMLGIRRSRGSTKLVELWRHTMDRKKPAPGETLSGGGWDWWTVSGTTLLIKAKQTGCVHALGLDDGKALWKSCEIGWPAPPLTYKGKLYHATGRFKPAKPSSKQGLLAIDPYSGKIKQVRKIPGPSSATDRYMQASFAPMRKGTIYLLTHGPRLRALRVAK